ncbi:CheR family methyltransferase [Georgenia thermotolerans]|uniref:protein-glutamate O-methyltransferase n=1 Tax=Georgenia thermotolerans TaxID=527326 RepID=A0A7J5UK53_9MICO|nr:protein-glutamate O-methyltransferase CheR [Georgenia thermotolerans]KAE8762737.1 methyltransferase domain-containing protein [Georgenia thermotolerans]
MSLSAASFDFVADLVRRESAVELDGKEYLVESRLAPLARAAGIDGARAVDRYVHLLRRSARPASDVVEALVTTETSWFRDRPTFDALTGQLLPALADRGPLRVWSAGCSTGQEPYSVVMALLDAGADAFSVLATDVSATVLERARAGRYTALEMGRGLPRSAWARYFTPRAGEWQVAARVRERVDLRRHSLLEPSPAAHAGTFDVVLLRHVLMYFDLAARAVVLRRLRRCLAPGGFLVLGTTETPLGIDPAWDRVKIPGTSIYRLTGGSA